MRWSAGLALPDPVSERQARPNLRSYVPGANLRRLSADWGRHLELAQTLVDPACRQSTVYVASNWALPGRTRAFRRSNGSCSDPHGKPMQMLAHHLRERLRTSQEQPEWGCRPVKAASTRDELRALRAQLEGADDIPNFRRACARASRCSGTGHLHADAAGGEGGLYGHVPLRQATPPRRQDRPIPAPQAPELHPTDRIPAGSALTRTGSRRNLANLA